MMRPGALALTAILCAFCAQASWYWPFGSDEVDPEGGKKELPRLSDLMEPATTNIDAAADYAAEGKVKEAQDSYRAALAALERIERENPERAATPEFATVRNKRAYINAALDAMLLAEARENAKAVAVTDTTSLEMKIVRKPWDEMQPTCVALTNADALVGRRLAFMVKSETRKMLAEACSNEAMRVVCTSNRQALARLAPRLATTRADMTAAYRAAERAVARAERFSDVKGGDGALHVFDICREDARKAVAVCKDAWPKFSEVLTQMNDHLMGLYELLPGTEVVRAAWGGEDVTVPTREDDRGLVTNEGDERPDVTSQVGSYMQQEREHLKKVSKRAEKVKSTRRRVAKEVKELLAKDPKSRKARMLMAGEDLRNGDLKAARAKVDALLEEKPNDGPALNMRAAIESAEGDLKAAEKTLDQAIQSNPRDYHAYYNMANVYLQKGNRESAKRYYETGRTFSGPRNRDLEKAISDL